MKKYKIFFSVFAIVAVLAIVGVIVFTSEKSPLKNSGSKKDTVVEEPIALDKNDEQADFTEAEQTPEPEAIPEPFKEYDIHLLAVGDNLFHTGVINGGLQADGSYNYDFEFDGIKEFLELADIKIINQETPLGGNERGFSSYPVFNTPTQVGDAIANANFNVVLGATNHATDQGISGLYNFYNYFATNYPQILVCGIHGENIQSKLPHTVTGEEGVNIVVEEPGTASDITPEELAISVAVDNNINYARIGLLDIQGVTFAILNYTYGNNTEIYPSSSEGHLDSLCSWDPNTRYYDFNSLNPQVLEDIKLAETIADVTIVCPHWGVEYQTSPSSNQISWAKQMIECGADVIIGTHPHVVQPMEWVTADNGNEAVVYYSLGNYASTQNQATQNLFEAMAWVSFHVTEESITINKNETGAVPLVDHYTFDPLKYRNTYLLEDYNADLAASHGVLGWGGFSLKMENLESLRDSILGDSVITRAEILAQFAS